MRITFLCSSLEPGRDGVGDYVRRLASELTHGGHTCQLVALHDRWINAVQVDATSLRMPATLPWSEKGSLANNILTRFAPNWVSLQLVSYGYQDKGVVFSLVQPLVQLTAVYRLHIMLHELWVGDTSRAPWRERLAGAVQRASIKHLLRRAAPEVVTTSNHLFQTMLAREGWPARVLPLFSNIPIVEQAMAQPIDRGAGWIFVFFGTLHPEWEPDPLFSIIRRAATRAGKTVLMLAVGRLGAGEALWEKLRQKYDSDFQFKSLGEQPASRISETLQDADAGIAVSPWELMGKSGSAASMVEHGLPVIVTRLAASSAGEEMSSPNVACDEFLEEKLVRGLPKRPPASRLPEVAAAFVQLLAGTSHASPIKVESLPLLTRLLVALARHWPLRRGRSRWRAWVSASLRGRPALVRTRLAESALTIAVPWQDLTGAAVITFGDSEPDVFRLICSRLRARATGQDLFVDVGANLGVFALRIAERFQDCRVIAFEPNPRIAALLRENMSRLGLSPRIDLREVALGEHDVEARLATVEGDSGLSSIRSDAREGIRVTVRRLATELSIAEWKRIAVMKIDVEGYELGVFRGAEPLFAQHLPVLVFEVNRPELRAHGLEPRALGDFLRRVGYERLLALNGVLYPPENGLYEVCNLVALPAEARAFPAQHGFDPDFAPRPESMWPTVQYPV